MYEGIKIMFAGWLLLAHLDISRPASQPPRQSHIIPEDSRHHSSQRAQLETQHNHLHRHPTISRQSSYISATERIPATPGRDLKADGDSVISSTMRATNLDFGRFKRDLERRRSHSRTHSHVTEDAILVRTNSRLGHVEPSPSAPIFHSKEDFQHTPPSASVPQAASLYRGHGSTTSTPATAAQQVTPVQDPIGTHSGKRSPFGMFLFGSEKSSLKRPLSAMSEDRPSPSLARNTSNLSSRSQQPRPSALHRTPSGQRSGGEHRVRINAESPGGKNKRQRHSPDDRDKVAEPEGDERSRTRKPKYSQNTSSDNTGSNPTNAPTPATIPTTTPNATTSSTKFSRPKPPRKNRSESQPETSGATASKDHRPQHRSLPESTSRDLFSPSATETAEEPQVVSASFESRMKNVRAWIKGRNPSMISPTLTATSEATATHPQLKRRSSSFLQQDEKPRSSGGKGGLDDLPKITKRKAARQLAPTANTKRWAAEDDLERPSQWTVEDDRIQRQNNDGSRRRRSREGTQREASSLYPDLTGDAAAPRPDRQRARDFSFSQPMAATRRYSATRISDERSRPSSLPTNVDWDRFQRLIGTAPKRSSSSSTLLTSTGPSNAFHRKSSITTLVNHQDDNSTVAPLIKLRQSQLRQHQEEDFFGVKRNDGEGSRNKFDSTLDLWEREDDETLARNAAREAEEVEARSQLRLSQGRHDSSSSSSLLSESPVEDERAIFTFSSPSRISRTSILATDPGYEMAAPTPSLLRTIPFNGESSRRPVPDFQPKKSASTARLQETIKSSSPARRTPHSGQDNSNPFLEKGTSSGGGGGRSAPPPPRFNFNFAGAASLAKKRAHSHQPSHQGAKASPEEVAARRERHPGLYTPSKKKATTSATAGAGGTNSSEQQGSALWKESQLNRPSSSPFKHPSTPTTMSRYIELSSLSDDDK